MGVKSYKLPDAHPLVPPALFYSGRPLSLQQFPVIIGTAGGK